MRKIRYQVKNPQGIHARPAMQLVNHFSGLNCNISIEKDKKAVNGKKIFALMSLSIKHNDIITITFEGEGEEAAVEAAGKFLRNFNVIRAL